MVAAAATPERALCETCDGADHDCDGTPDNGLSFVTYWPDVDDDGEGTRT